MCHRDVAKTACPGKHFRLDELLNDDTLTVTIGTATVSGRIIDGKTYVPLNDLMLALTTRLCVVGNDIKLV